MPFSREHSGRRMADSAGKALPPLLLITAAWWLLTRPYRGIWHDGLFYSVQALRRLHPENYAGDVFFLYGSQDKFTLMTGLQAWLSGWLGLERAFLLLSIAGAALWCYALLRLLRRWMPSIPLAASLILVLSFDAHYGGFDVFSYGESFATPRIFSEALVLLALPWWLAGRRLTAVCVLAVAALFHPLMALAGVGIFAWAFMLNRVRHALKLWLVLLALGVLGMQLLLWMGLSPWLDPDWRRLAVQRSPFVFPHLWGLGDWLRLVLDAFLLWLSSKHLRGEPGRLAAWTLPVLALAMLWALAASVMGVQLAVAAQLHRVQWIAHVLALALAVPLCLHLWRESRGWDHYLAIGVAGSLAYPLGLGGLVLPFIYMLFRWGEYRLPQGPDRHKPAFIMFVVLLLSGFAIWLFYLGANLMLPASASSRPLWLVLLIQPPVALGVFIAGHALSGWAGRQQSWLYAYGVCMLAVGIFHWDQSKPWGIAYDQASRAVAITSVRAIIPETAVVYWESGSYVTPAGQAGIDRGFERAWFWLRRANYASFDQAAGGVFYRETAIEIARRIAHLRSWGFRDSTLDLAQRFELPAKLPLTRERLYGVCADRMLDFVITDAALAVASMNFQDPATGRKFSVYDCRKLRSLAG